jgi:cephalosporin hydroxylase
MPQPKTLEEQLPPAVSIDLRQSLREYWLDRVRAHEQDHYAGAGMAKFPEDLRVYEHLLWADAPDTVIEIGALDGGSALWFRDRLRTLQCYGRIDRYRVITIDMNAERVQTSLSAADPAWQETITVVQGDVRDDALPARVAGLLAPGTRSFVVEDSGHTYETTTAALRGFAQFVPPGGHLVVEDGCVDVPEMRASPHWPCGVRPAIADWLATAEGAGFRIRRDLERYGLSCHPGGFLQRTPAP